jgi:hypothetical protein
MHFKVVSEDTWRFSGRVRGGRRKKLLKTPFEDIVERIEKEALLGSHYREPIRRHPGSHRIVLKLVMSAEALDLFHNGAGGYRAQFLAGALEGIAAKRFVIGVLLRRLERLGNARLAGECTWDFLERSLCDPDAKVWIHQGTWFRQSRLLDRNLVVERWCRNGEEMVLRKGRMPIWAKLTPSCETRLELKGGCLDATNKTIGVQLKPHRSCELHCLGYT